MNRREAVTAIGALALSACVPDSVTDVPNLVTPLTTNVYEFPGWENPRSEFGKVPGTQCPNQYPWSVIRTNDRVPLLGEYNEAEPRIQEYRASLMESAGINCAVIQVEWLNRKAA